MEYIGIIGIIALLGLFWYALKSYKSPYDEKRIERLLEENRKEVFRYLQRIKDKRQ